jgi:hypothetical protein
MDAQNGHPKWASKIDLKLTSGLIEKNTNLAYFSTKALSFFLTVRRRTRRNERPWMGSQRVRKKESALVEKYSTELKKNTKGNAKKTPTES